MCKMNVRLHVQYFYPKYRSVDIFKRGPTDPFDLELGVPENFWEVLRYFIKGKMTCNMNLFSNLSHIYSDFSLLMSEMQNAL